MPLEIHVLYVLVRVISANVQNCNKYLIHPFPAILGAAHAGDLVVILEIKLKERKNYEILPPSTTESTHFIVIRELLPPVDPPGGEDDDVSVRQLHRLRHAVGVAGVVDVPGHTASHCGVHHPLVVQAEHVDTAVLVLVPLLSDISQVGSKYCP